MAQYVRQLLMLSADRLEGQTTFMYNDRLNVVLLIAGLHNAFLRLIRNRLLIKS